MKWFKSSRVRILFFLAALGPGFITANVDNDAGGILTYSQAGAQYGYSLLWTMIPITLALIVVQEMCARMGAVTGKGLWRRFSSSPPSAISRTSLQACWAGRTGRPPCWRRSSCPSVPHGLTTTTST